MFSSVNTEHTDQSNSTPATPKSLKEDTKEKPQLLCFHIQRIPANTKVTITL